MNRWANWANWANWAIIIAGVVITVANYPEAKHGLAAIVQDLSR